MIRQEKNDKKEGGGLLNSVTCSLYLDVLVIIENDYELNSVEITEKWMLHIVLLCMATFWQDIFTLLFFPSQV